MLRVCMDYNKNMGLSREDVSFIQTLLRTNPTSSGTPLVAGDTPTVAQLSPESDLVGYKK